MKVSLCVPVGAELLKGTSHSRQARDVRDQLSRVAFCLDLGVNLIQLCLCKFVLCM
jgi:hypothetical protein